MTDSAAHWNELHANPRFLPLYPSEDVVRFLMSLRAQLPAQAQYRLLDIGTGGGRHMRLAAELGFYPFGVDISFTGLSHARKRMHLTNLIASVAVASMTTLPFADASFHAVVSYGSFYYGSAQVMRRAVAEAHRVLAPGGKSFVVLRSIDDYRYGKGRERGSNTFELDISETNEVGTIQHFLAAEDIPEYFNLFSKVSFEKAEWTVCGRTRLNSDWLITAEK
ncbi:MAG TPA: class I SAM-dependent methyltransferase [Terriglobales bacterium]